MAATGERQEERQNVRYVTGAPDHAVEFSFCTLVAKDDNYQRLLKSAYEKGFTPANAEFIALDNRGRNRFDGYSALRRAVLECRGRYVVFTHDDVEFTHDDAATLSRLLEELDRAAPDWTIAGNAGGRIGAAGKRALALHVQDPNWHHEVPGITEVESLDENFFIMRRDRVVLNSFDLSGFHLYAGDLCLLNEVLGGRSYVIPFMITHHSSGKTDESFHGVLRSFEAKYRRYFVGRKYRTTCARIDFGISGLRDSWRLRSQQRRALALALEAERTTTTSSPASSAGAARRE